MGNPDRPDLFYRDLESGEVHRLTTSDLEKSTGEYQISPDKKRIVYELGTGTADLLMLSDLEGSDISNLADDKTHKRYLAWHPNSADIAYVSNGRKLMLVDIEASSQSPLYTSNLLIKSPRFSPTGTQLLFTEVDRSGFGWLKIYELESGKITSLLDTPRAVSAPQWISEKRIIFREIIDDQYLLRILKLGEKDPTPIGPSEGVIYTVKIQPQDNKAIVAHANLGTPLAFSAIDLQTNSIIQLSRPDKLRAKDILPMKREIIEEQGRQVPLYIVEPPGSGTKRKLDVVLWLHGSGGGFSPRWHAYAQYFAHSGYLFMAVNYKSGKIGRKQRDYKLKAVMRAYKYIRSRQDVNFSRVFLLGVSSGSVLARQVVNEHPSTFRGVVEYSPAGDWRALRIGAGVPARILFWGENDHRLESARLQQANISRNLRPVPLQHFVLEGEGHDIRLKQNMQERLDLTAGFMQKQ